MFSSDLPGPPALLCWGPQQATRARSEPSQFPSENEHIAHPSPRCSERIGRWDRSGAPGGRETESRAAPSAPALYAGLQLLSSGGLFQTRLQQGPKYPGKSIIGQSCQPLSGFRGMRLCCPEPDAVPALPEPLPLLILGSGPPAAARPPPILPDPPTLRGQICLPLGSLPAPPSPSAPLLSLAGRPYSFTTNYWKLSGFHPCSLSTFTSVGVSFKLSALSNMYLPLTLDFYLHLRSVP